MAAAPPDADILPFLSWDYPPLDMVVRFSKCVDLLKISLLSRLCGRKMCKALSRIKSVNVDVDANGIRMFFEDKRAGVPVTTWAIPREILPEMGLNPRSERAAVDDEPFDCDNYQFGPNHLQTIFTRRVEGTTAALRHVEYVFRCPFNHVNVNAADTPAIWSALPQCTNANFNYDVTDEVLDEFFNRCTVSGTLTFTSRDSSALSRHFQRMMKTPHVVISNSQWITVDEMRLIPCVTFRMENASVTSADLRYWVFSWVAGHCWSLRKLVVVSNRNRPPFDRNVISSDAAWSCPHGDDAQVFPGVVLPYKATVYGGENREMTIEVVGNMVHFNTTTRET